MAKIVIKFEPSQSLQTAVLIRFLGERSKLSLVFIGKFINKGCHAVITYFVFKGLMPTKMKNKLSFTFGDSSLRFPTVNK